MADEVVFNLCSGDILAANFQHILDSIAVGNATVLIHMSQVSCLEITVTIKALVSQFRLEVIAVERVRSSEANFPDTAGREGLASLRVTNSGFHTWKRMAAGIDTGIEWVRG